MVCCVAVDFDQTLYESPFVIQLGLDPRLV